MVPQALQQFDGKAVVFTQVEGDLRDAQALEITSGLSAGAHYAADNSYLIKADLLKTEGGED